MPLPNAKEYTGPLPSHVLVATLDHHMRVVDKGWIPVSDRHEINLSQVPRAVRGAFYIPLLEKPSLSELPSPRFLMIRYGTNIVTQDELRYLLGVQPQLITLFLFISLSDEEGYIFFRVETSLVVPKKVEADSEELADDDPEMPVMSAGLPTYEEAVGGSSLLLLEK